MEALDIQLTALSIDESYANRFRESLKTLWSENGNAISHLYAGTGALESGSRIQDAQRSISRINYLDEKQKLIDRLLYGNLPSTLQGQKTLALIGSNAVGLSPKTRENIYFRKDHAAVEIPIRVNPIYCFA